MKEAIQRTIEAYNKYAGIYAEYHDEKLMQFQLTKFISLLKDRKILDVGCGSGRDTNYFNEEGYNAIGVDLAENMIQEASRNYPKCRFLKMDMIDLDFEDSEFDGIWIMASLSNVMKKDIRKVLSEIKRVLKDNGILYIAVKKGNKEGFIKKQEFNDEEVWYAYYEKEELENLLKEQGFVILSSAEANDEKTNWVEVFAEKRG